MKNNIIPSNNLFSSSNGKLESGGEYEVLTYDMQVHKISVSDYNYIINETVSNKVFKSSCCFFDLSDVFHKTIFLKI